MLDAVLVARAYNTNHLFYLLDKVLRPKLLSDDCDVGVVVLDGLSSLRLDCSVEEELPPPRFFVFLFLKRLFFNSCCGRSVMWQEFFTW